MPNCSGTPITQDYHGCVPTRLTFNMRGRTLELRTGICREAEEANRPGCLGTIGLRFISLISKKNFPITQPKEVRHGALPIIA